MSTPHKCPVCDGTGLVSRPPWVAGDVSRWSSTQSTYPCKACGGTGVLWGNDYGERINKPMFPDRHVNEQEGLI